MNCMAAGGGKQCISAFHNDRRCSIADRISVTRIPFVVRSSDRGLATRPRPRRIEER